MPENTYSGCENARVRWLTSHLREPVSHRLGSQIDSFRKQYCQ